ncbi:T6SS effector BTH_I2691 family protein [Halomonas mongoliensis]|uniref:T6SS effector BTH_I2691 family protein n=1 Tax=Halomonas mongoliensis TaxID=321265 RepID=UPI00403B012F
MTLTIDPSQAAAAVANSTAAGVGALDCPFCTRVGLPILPVRYAVVDAHGGEWPVGLPWAMATYANGNYPSPGHARYVLRLMREGYLYLYDEARQRWQAWMITADSRLCEFPPRGRPPTAQDDEHVDAPCHVAANNLSALLISLPGADQARVVHVAYSDHRWTASMLDAMAANDDGIRDRVMQPFDVEAWLANQQAPSATLPPHIATYLPEFSGADMAQLFGGDCFPYPGAGARQLLDAEQLIARMNWIVRDTPEWTDKGAVLAIEDPIGITASLNQFRNNARTRLDEYARSEDIVEKRATSEIIQGIRATFEESAARRADAHIEHVQNGPLLDLNMDDARRFEALAEQEQQARWARMNDIQRERLRQGQKDLADLREAQASNAPEYRQRAIDQSWEKYLGRYDEDAREAFDEVYENRIQQGQEEIEEWARPHIQWLSSGAVGDAMASYDPQSQENGQAHEVAVAAMLTGVSQTAAGIDVLSELLDRPVDDIGSYVWRAFFGNYQPALDMVADYAQGSVDWGRRVIGPLRRLLAADREHRSRIENLIADIAGVLAQKLGMVSATEIANNAMARLWQAVSWARFGEDISLLKYRGSAQSLATLYGEILWRDEHAVHAMRGSAHRLFPVIEQLPEGQGEQRLWAFIPTELDPQQRAVIEAELVDSIEWRRLAINNAMTPGTWFGVFAAGLEVINTLKAWKALGDENAETNLAEQGGIFAASSLFLISTVTGVANSIAMNIARETVKEKALYKGLAWTSGITAALGSWIFAGITFVKGIDAYRDNDNALTALYASTTTILLGAGVTSLLATGQAVGMIKSTEAAIGRIVISRAGWGLVAARLGWVGLALVVLTVIFEKDQLEKWLERCVFAEPGGPEKFENLQAALDNLREMSE